MILVVFMALLCAAALIWVLDPLMKQKNRQPAFALMIVIPVAAIGLYLAQGEPDIPSAPALFEQAGPRHDRRLAQQQELILLEALAGDPDNPKILGELERLRRETGISAPSAPAR